jgi:hypothetical protein
MDWSIIRASFFDELEKISSVSLTGLSPRTVLELGSRPEPFQTPEVQKALSVLDRAEQIEKSAQASDGKSYEKIRPYGRSALSGASAGGLFANILFGRRRRRLKLLGSVGVGAALGVADRVAADQKMGQSVKFTPTATKTASAFSTPATALRAAKMVGAPSKSIKQGPSLAHQIKGKFI